MDEQPGTEYSFRGKSPRSQGRGLLRHGVRNYWGRQVSSSSAIESAALHHAEQKACPTAVTDHRVIHPEDSCQEGKPRQQAKAANASRGGGNGQAVKHAHSLTSQHQTHTNKPKATDQSSGGRGRSGTAPSSRGQQSPQEPVHSHQSQRGGKQSAASRSSDSSQAARQRNLGSSDKQPCNADAKQKQASGDSHGKSDSVSRSEEIAKREDEPLVHQSPQAGQLCKVSHKALDGQTSMQSQAVASQPQLPQVIDVKPSQASSGHTKSLSTPRTKAQSSEQEAVHSHQSSQEGKQSIASTNTNRTQIEVRTQTTDSNHHPQKAGQKPTQSNVATVKTVSESASKEHQEKQGGVNEALSQQSRQAGKQSGVPHKAHSSQANGHRSQQQQATDMTSSQTNGGHTMSASTPSSKPLPTGSDFTRNHQTNQEDRENVGLPKTGNGRPASKSQAAEVKHQPLEAGAKPNQAKGGSSSAPVRKELQSTRAATQSHKSNGEEEYESDNVQVAGRSSTASRGRGRAGTVTGNRAQQSPQEPLHSHQPQRGGKQSAESRSSESSQKQSAVSRSSDSSQKQSAVSCSSDSSQKQSAVSRSSDSSQKQSAVSRSSDSSRKQSAVSRSSDSSQKQSAVSRSSDSSQEQSAVSRSSDSSQKQSAVSRSSDSSQKQSAVSRSSDSSQKQSAVSRSSDSSQKQSAVSRSSDSSQKQSAVSRTSDSSQAARQGNLGSSDKQPCNANTKQKQASGASHETSDSVSRSEEIPKREDEPLVHQSHQAGQLHKVSQNALNGQTSIQSQTVTSQPQQPQVTDMKPSQASSGHTKSLSTPRTKAQSSEQEAVHSHQSSQEGKQSIPSTNTNRTQIEVRTQTTDSNHHPQKAGQKPTQSNVATVKTVSESASKEHQEKQGGVNEALSQQSRQAGKQSGVPHKAHSSQANGHRSQQQQATDMTSSQTNGGHTMSASTPSSKPLPTGSDFTRNHQTNQEDRENVGLPKTGNGQPASKSQAADVKHQPLKAGAKPNQAKGGSSSAPVRKELQSTRAATQSHKSNGEEEYESDNVQVAGRSSTASRGRGRAGTVTGNRAQQSPQEPLHSHQPQRGGKQSAESRSSESSQKQSAVSRSSDSSQKQSAVSCSSDSSQKQSAVSRSSDSSQKQSAVSRSSDSSQKQSAVSRSSDSSQKQSAVSRSSDSSQKQSAVSRSSDSSQKQSAVSRSSDSSQKQSAVSRSSDSSQKQSAVSRSSDSSRKQSAVSRSSDSSQKQSAVSRSSDSSQKQSAVSRTSDSSQAARQGNLGSSDKQPCNANTKQKQASGASHETSDSVCRSEEIPKREDEPLVHQSHQAGQLRKVSQNALNGQTSIQSQTVTSQPQQPQVTDMKPSQASSGHTKSLSTPRTKAQSSEQEAVHNHQSSQEGKQSIASTSTDRGQIEVRTQTTDSNHHPQKAGQKPIQSNAATVKTVSESASKEHQEKQGGVNEALSQQSRQAGKQSGVPHKAHSSQANGHRSQQQQATDMTSSQTNGGHTMSASTPSSKQLPTGSDFTRNHQTNQEDRENVGLPKTGNGQPASKSQAAEVKHQPLEAGAKPNQAKGGSSSAPVRKELQSTRAATQSHKPNGEEEYESDNVQAVVNTPATVSSHQAVGIDLEPSRGRRRRGRRRSRHREGVDVTTGSSTACSKDQPRQEKEAPVASKPATSGMDKNTPTKENTSTESPATALLGSEVQHRILESSKRESFGQTSRHCDTTHQVSKVKGESTDETPARDTAAEGQSLSIANEQTTVSVEYRLIMPSSAKGPSSAETQPKVEQAVESRPRAATKQGHVSTDGKENCQSSQKGAQFSPSNNIPVTSEARSTAVEKTAMETPESGPVAQSNRHPGIPKHESRSPNGEMTVDVPMASSKEDSQEPRQAAGGDKNVQKFSQGTNAPLIASDHSNGPSYGVRSKPATAGQQMAGHAKAQSEPVMTGQHVTRQVQQKSKAATAGQQITGHIQPQSKPAMVDQQVTRHVYPQSKPVTAGQQVIEHGSVQPQSEPAVADQPAVKPTIAGEQVTRHFQSQSRPATAGQQVTEHTQPLLTAAARKALSTISVSSAHTVTALPRDNLGSSSPGLQTESKSQSSSDKTVDTSHSSAGTAFSGQAIASPTTELSSRILRVPDQSDTALLGSARSSSALLINDGHKTSNPPALDAVSGSIRSSPSVVRQYTTNTKVQGDIKKADSALTMLSTAASALGKSMAPPIAQSMIAKKVSLFYSACVKTNVAFLFDVHDFLYFALPIPFLPLSCSCGTLEPNKSNVLCRSPFSLDLLEHCMYAPLSPVMQARHSSGTPAQDVGRHISDEILEGLTRLGDVLLRKCVHTYLCLQYECHHRCGHAIVQTLLATAELHEINLK